MNFNNRRPTPPSAVAPKDVYLSTRDFMKVAVIAVAGAWLAACAPKVVPTVDKVAWQSASEADRRKMSGAVIEGWVKQWQDRYEANTNSSFEEKPLTEIFADSDTMYVDASSMALQSLSQQNMFNSSSKLVLKGPFMSVRSDDLTQLNKNPLVAVSQKIVSTKDNKSQTGMEFILNVVETTLGDGTKRYDSVIVQGKGSYPTLVGDGVAKVITYGTLLDATLKLDYPESPMVVNSIIYGTEYGASWGDWIQNVQNNVQQAEYQPRPEPTAEMVNFKNYLNGILDGEASLDWEYSPTTQTILFGDQVDRTGPYLYGSDVFNPVCSAYKLKVIIDSKYQNGVETAPEKFNLIRKALELNKKFFNLTALTSESISRIFEVNWKQDEPVGSPPVDDCQPRNMVILNYPRFNAFGQEVSRDEVPVWVGPTK